MYVVLDLEATCWDENLARSPFTHVEPISEIIEIGAVMMRKDLSIVSEFDAIIHPVLNPTLSDFCKGLTSIRQDMVDYAKPFPEVLEEFKAWLGDPANKIFVSWGNYDRNQLHKDCERHKVSYPFNDKHMNIKWVVGKTLGKQRGVGRTIEHLGMKFEGTQHRGIDDVKNIIRIWKEVAPKIVDIERHIAIIQENV